jgi:phage I-like protein
MNPSVIQAVSLLLDILSAASSLTERAMTISALIQKAQAEGRLQFTDEEWAQITQADDAARKRLVDAINQPDSDGGDA